MATPSPPFPARELWRSQFETCKPSPATSSSGDSSGTPESDTSVGVSNYDVSRRIQKASAILIEAQQEWLAAISALGKLHKEHKTCWTKWNEQDNECLQKMVAASGKVAKTHKLFFGARGKLGKVSSLRARKEEHGGEWRARLEGA